jgi:hypothetical protein
MLFVGNAVLFFVAITADFDGIAYKLWLFFAVGALLSTMVTVFVEDFLAMWTKVMLKTHITNRFL